LQAGQNGTEIGNDTIAYCGMRVVLYAHLGFSV
jgi:hypothetical protein